MPLLVVRHGSAGKSSEWEGEDRLRPLDDRGRQQADRLVTLLGRYPVDRVLSSSYVRCLETVEPLAAARGVAVEERRELEEGASRGEALSLLADAGDRAVLCTHGDVLEELFGVAGKKGSTRVVELREGEPVVGDHLKPPA